MLRASATLSACRVTSAAGDGRSATRRTLFHRSRPVTRPARRWRRMRLERLEDRTVPATITWDGGPTGQGANWLDRVNWVGDVLPGPNDDALIGPAAPGQPAEITLTGSASVHSATVTGRTLSLLNSTFSGSLVNHGTVRTTAATVNAVLANEGTITISGDTTWNSPDDSGNSGTIDVTGGNLTVGLSATGAALVNTGAVTVAAGRTMMVSGGAFSQTGGTTTVSGPDPIVNASGTLTATGGLWLRGGTLTGRGEVGPLSQTGGMLSPGPSFGTLTVNGSFSQTGGVLAVTVSGGAYPTNPLIAGIKVNGSVALSGTVAVTIGSGGAIPNVDYRIIDNDGSDPVTGTFTGLPEGGRLMAGVQRVNIGYLAGTGNDVVLRLDPPATFVWDGGPTGKGTDWFDPANWAGDLVPINGDKAVIGPLAGSPTVVIVAGNGAVLNTVTVESGVTLRVVGGFLLADLINSGTVELTSSGGRPAQLWGFITNSVGGVITMLAASGVANSENVSISNQGTITVAGDTTWRPLYGFASTNAGTINVTTGKLTLDQSGSGATFGNTGTVNVASGSTFTIIGGTFTNYGNSTLTGGTYNIAGTFRFSGAAIAALGADLTLDGPGAAVVDSTTSSNALARLTNIFGYGRMTLRNGGNLQQSSPGSGIINFGTLTVGAGCTLNNNVDNGGTITGSGSLSLINNDGGTVRPGEPMGTLTFNGSYNNAGGLYNSRGTLEIDLNGASPGTGYDQVIANLNVFLGGKLVVKSGYTAAPGERFTIIDNRGGQPIFGTFDGLAEGAVLTAGGQDFRISYVGGDGNDVTLTRAGPVVPKVDSVQVNDGAAQRSRVTSLTVAFNTDVTFAGPAANAFILTRDSDAATVTFTATTSVTGGVTFVTLGQFTGLATEAGSLADGRYTLTVRASQVSTAAGSLDGNRDGTPGDDYAFGGLRRVYGDASGDAWVDAVDLALFRQTFGSVAGDASYLSYLDANADGANNGIELTRFRQAYTDSPPRVSTVQVNDGSAQRSRVTSLSVTFSTSVTFAGSPEAAFVITRADGTPVTFAATVTIIRDATRVTLDRFAGPAVEAGSLADGQYTLKVLATQVATPGGRLDGNGDGTPGDDYSFGAAQGLFRHYGDANGDGKVDATDLALFRETFGRVAGDPLYLSLFDANGDGTINGADLTRFRQAFGAG